MSEDTRVVVRPGDPDNYGPDIKVIRNLDLIAQIDVKIRVTSLEARLAAAEAEIVALKKQLKTMNAKMEALLI